MRRLFNAGIIALIAVLMLASSCSNKAEDAASSENTAPASDETELDSAEGCALSAQKEGKLEKGDIIIVYNAESMAACCFECTKDSVKLMYNGDYKGSYAVLECVFQKDYEMWSVMAYRKTQGNSDEPLPDDLDDVAQHILDEYLEKYGELRAGSFICITDDDGGYIQYATLTDGTVERISDGDIRSYMWQDSENSDDYWAKLIHENPEGSSWVIYEYDKQCSKAFDTTVDAIDIISEQMNIPDGSIFICDRGERQIALEYSAGAVVYVQPVDLAEKISSMSELDKSAFANLPKAITIYIPEV